MAKTMEIFRAVVLALVLVPLVKATSVEEELAQLKEIVSALQAQVDRKVDTTDFTAQMEKKVDTIDFNVKLNDTEELEARVTVLEESVADLETGFVALTDEVDDVESVNILQDDRINTLEAEIFDNENDIEELVDVTTGLTTQVLGLEEDVIELDQRVGHLESGGGGNGNDTDLEVRVEALEEVTSQLTDDVSSLEDNDVTQDERISGLEENVMSLDQRVEDLESGGGSGNSTDYSDSIFMAALTFTQTSDRDPLVFENDVINPGSYYSTSTGKYTVPYDGIYQFSVHLAAPTGTLGTYFYMEIDDSSSDTHVDGWSGETYRSTTILHELTAGQTVHVKVYNGAYGYNIGFQSYFSGYLVSAF